MSENKPMGWWTMSGEDFMNALVRCYNGENPEIIYTEMYANSNIEEPNNE